jgi:hypothetical protein
MRHMKKLLKYTLITALFAGGAACTNLDEKLPGTYTQNFTPSNSGFGVPANVNAPQPSDGLQAAFNTLLSGTATNGGFFAVQEGGTDEAVITQKGGDWYDGGLYIKIHQHTFTPQTWAINDTWNQAYNGIYQCNTLLATSLSAGQTAQLRFLRAYFYWRLLDVFGNVPIVTVAGTGASNAGTKGANNSTASEFATGRMAVYNFVVSELLAAVGNLPSGHQDYGRANQAGVYALLSRVYLNAFIYTGTQQYQAASDAADKVLNSNLYSLDANYASVFAPDNINPKEMIFAVPFDQTTGQGATWPHMTLHYPSQLTWQLNAQPWNGFSTLEDFYNSYDKADARKTANFITGQQYAQDGTTVLLDLAYTKGYPNGANLNYTPAINELYPNAWRAGGARFGKFSFKLYQLTNADNDYPILRLGEVVLNKAEALQRLNNNWNDPTALALVNQVRARAGVTPFATMASDGSDMLAERGRELFVESIRRTDMIRFDKYIHGTWWEHPTADGNPNFVVMAVPIEQMQAAASTAFPLFQNPGY